MNQTVADERCGIRVLEQVIDEALHFRQRMPGRNFKRPPACQDLPRHSMPKPTEIIMLCSLYTHFCADVPVCTCMFVASLGCVILARGLVLPLLRLLGIVELFNLLGFGFLMFSLFARQRTRFTVFHCN